MYSLPSLIMEQQSARRRLLKAFELQNGTTTRPDSDRTIFRPGRNRPAFGARIKIALKLFRLDSDNAQAIKIGSHARKSS
jgi:hypothetical protein